MSSFKEKVDSKNKRNDWLESQHDLVVDTLELGEKVACAGCHSVVGKDKRGDLYGVNAGGLSRNCRRFGAGRFRGYVNAIVNRAECLLNDPVEKAQIKAGPIFSDGEKLIS